MALPTIVVENAIADELVGYLKKFTAEMKLGLAYDKQTEMGPVVNKGHLEFVLGWIQTGVEEGAELILDGRNPEVPPECENGFFVGPTIFDHVTEEMSVGREAVSYTHLTLPTTPYV